MIRALLDPVKTALLLVVMFTMLAVAMSGSVATAAFAAAPEEPQTNGPAKSITGTSAVLEGVLNPGTEATAGWYFAYDPSPGTECTGALTSPLQPEAKVKAHLEKTEVTGLEPSRKYTFCLVATNAAGETTAGNEASFKTLGEAPEILPGRESVPSLAPFEATFEAAIDPENQETTYAFEYSTKGKTGAGETLEGTIATVDYASAFPPNELGERSVALATGRVLKSATTYFYRVVAADTTGTSRGKVESFTTPAAGPPKIESEEVPGLTATGATLEVVVNPEYQETSCEFRYGTDPSLATATTVACEPERFGTEGGVTGAIATLPGLEAGKTYYYQAIVENEASKKAGKPVEGEIKEFTTLAAFKLSVAGSGTGNGTISSAPAGIACGASCSVAFQQGTEVALTATPALGSTFLGWSGGGCLGTGTCTVTMAAEMTVSADFSQASPLILTEGSSALTASTAMLAGKVSPDGAPIEECDFEYGPTTSYGSLAACATSPGSSTSYAPVSAALVGLGGRTTYHYRLLASNTGGVTYGADMQFTTPESQAEIAAESAAKQQQEADAAVRKQQEEAAAAARQDQEAEAATAKKKHPEEAAASTAAAKKQQEEAAVTAAKKRQQEQAKTKAKKKNKKAKTKKKAKNKKKAKTKKNAKNKKRGGK